MVAVRVAFGFASLNPAAQSLLPGETQQYGIFGACTFPTALPRLTSASPAPELRERQREKRESGEVGGGGKERQRGEEGRGGKGRGGRVRWVEVGRGK